MRILFQNGNEQIVERPHCHSNLEGILRRVHFLAYYRLLSTLKFRCKKRAHLRSPSNPNCTSFAQLMPLSIQRMFSASSGGGMRTYEFFCHGCAKPFSKTLTLKEYEEGTVVCPDCGSDDVEQRLSSFYAVTSKKSA
jgi:putative FmdB family regulatory protein